MDIAKQNKTAPAILEALSEHGAMTVRELTQRIPSSTFKSVERNAIILADRRMIHIAKWIPPKGKGSHAPLYAFGPGVNKRRPRKTPDKARKYKAAWARARRAQDRKAKAFSNPFASLMLQIDPGSVRL